MLEKCEPQIWLCLFMCRCITLKQLNNLTIIDAFSSLDGQEIMHQTTFPKVPDSIRGSHTDIFNVFFNVVVAYVLFWCKDHFFVMECCHAMLFY